MSGRRRRGVRSRLRCDTNATCEPSGLTTKLRCPHPPRRAGLFCRLGENRLTVDADVEPAACVVDPHLGPVGHKSRLLYCCIAVVATGIIRPIAPCRSPDQRRPMACPAGSTLATPRWTNTVTPLGRSRTSRNRCRDAAAQTARNVDIHSLLPYLGIVDGENEVLAVRRHVRRPALTTERSQLHRCATDRLPPDLTVDRCVDEPQPAGMPAEATPAHSPAPAPGRGPWRRDALRRRPARSP